MGGLGVIVVTFNSSQPIASCLRSLSETLPECPLCVVDNCSADDTVEVVRRRFPDVRLERRSRNEGYAVACNRGFAALAADNPSAVLIVNPDVCLERADSDGILSALSPADVSHGCGFLTNFNGWGRFPTTSAWRDMLKYSWFLVKPRAWHIPVRRGALGGKGQWAGGALVAVKSRSWQDVGGFDESFFLYYEDREFSERLQSHGRLVDIPSLVGMHAQGTGSSPTTTDLPVVAAIGGWLMYIRLRQGARASRAWAGLLQLNLDVIRLLLGIGGLAPIERVRRKRGQVTRVSQTLRACRTTPAAQDSSPAVAALSRALARRKR